MARYLSSLLCKLLLCDFTTRVTVRRLFNFCCAHILQEENHSNLPQAVSHCLIIYKYIYVYMCIYTTTVILLRILYFYCVFQKLQPVAGRLIPLLCSDAFVCLVRQQQHWRWRKHFVLFLKPLKLTSSKGGDVMWNEWLLFLSNFTILAWNLISYPIPIKEHPPPPPPFFNKRDLIDVQKDVFFFFPFVLVSGLMQCLLD